MIQETIAVIVLGLMFVVAAVRPVNMGLLGFVAAFAVGVFVAGLDVRDVIAGLPADLLVTLLGVTFLFAVAQGNGAVARMISGVTRVIGGGAVALPWAMFLIAALLTGVGALSPAAVAILSPLAIGLGIRAGVSPLLMGLMVIHGAQAGGFSPLSVYGGITREVVERAGLDWQPLAPFLVSIVANVLAAAGVQVVMSRRGAPARNVPEPARADLPAQNPADDRMQVWATYAALAILAVLTLIYELQIGLVAISLGVLITLIWPADNDPLKRLPWSEIVLITGVGTYVAVLQKMGVIDLVGNRVAGLGSPALAALLLLFIAAVVSAFASSAAVLGSLIPLAVPFLAGQPPLAVSAFVAAMAVAATIVDVSPFSTNGALVLANLPPESRDRSYRGLLYYGALICILAPVALWAAVLLRS